MFLHKVPAVKTPETARFGAAIFLAVFYFWFTRPETKTSAQPKKQGQGPTV